MDGYTSIGIGGTYTLEKVEISGGLKYVDIGQATTRGDGRFSDNHSWGFGLSLLYRM